MQTVFNTTFDISNKNKHEMKSEVELNKELIEIGDVLYYTDASNTEKWTVESVFENGFEAVDSDGYQDFFFFYELQLGWEISEKTKERHRIEDRYIYI